MSSSTGSSNNAAAVGAAVAARSASASASASTPAAAPVKISTAEMFAVGSCAAMTAVLFSNPAESIKTRMQLQGELAESSTRAASAAANARPGAGAGAGAAAASTSGAAHAPPTRLYKNALDCFVKTARTEGVRGIQRGLGAALVYQVCLNGSRLGLYEPFRKLFNRIKGKDAKEVWAPGAFAAGASTGVVGGAYRKQRCCCCRCC